MERVGLRLGFQRAVGSVSILDGQQLSDRAAAAYLEHLGVDAGRGAVDAATLGALARAHVGRVPYENIDIYRGEHNLIREPNPEAGA